MLNKLVEYVRDGLVEQEHWGCVVTSGMPGADVFYLRSCAKPLQASLLIDYGLDKDFTDKELALCCASHAGEKCHVETAISLLKKTGLDESYLKCGLHKPISKTAKEELIRKSACENVFQNNCVGKHIMMLALCKLKNWDLATYDDKDHPLQIAIKNKIYELCEVKENYPVTKDGCGVPIHAMPLENMLKGYVNLFCNPKYKRIAQAFRNNPYLIGGEDRLDTKIMTSSNLVAKVGAGGLCIAVNLEAREAVVVKIADCDMKAREVVMLEALRQLGWANIQTDTDIRTLHGEKIGEIHVNLTNPFNLLQ